MSELPPWDDLVTGSNCPLCEPRPAQSDYMSFVIKLAVSTLYLNRNQASSGSCILIYDPRHVTRLDELSSQEWSRYASDLRIAESAIMTAIRPDHINVELLGNAVPHLHWHIIPRFKDDGRWGGPIWRTQLSDMPNLPLSDAKQSALAEKIGNSVSKLRDLSLMTDG